jgi:hypothetical protein
MAILTTIRDSWGWTGLQPAAVVERNAFGNVIVRAADGAYWRICPEELGCKVIARNDAEYAALWSSNDFQIDWQMTRLVELATRSLGPLGEDRCYCLKIPAVLGGRYELSNFGIITHSELLAFTGDVAEQVNDVPDGATVRFRWIK